MGGEYSNGSLRNRIWDYGINWNDLGWGLMRALWQHGHENLDSAMAGDVFVSWTTIGFSRKNLHCGVNKVNSDFWNAYNCSI